MDMQKAQEYFEAAWAERSAKRLRAGWEPLTEHEKVAAWWGWLEAVKKLQNPEG